MLFYSGYPRAILDSNIDYGLITLFSNTLLERNKKSHHQFETWKQQGVECFMLKHKAKHFTLSQLLSQVHSFFHFSVSWGKWEFLQNGSSYKMSPNDR